MNTQLLKKRFEETPRMEPQDAVKLAFQSAFGCGHLLPCETLCTERIRREMDELSAKRREKQPLNFPSAGSTFKRPEGYFAGKLIMDAGLRGYSIGGAAVSEKHCGFVINKGNATAADVSEVIAEVQERVKDKFGVTLECEVIRLGNF